MVLLLWSVFLLVSGRRYAGEAGARRFEALSDERARAVHNTLGGSPRWAVGILAVLATAGTVLSASRGATLDACTTAAAVVVGLLSVPGLRSARDTVVHGLARRGLEPESVGHGLPASRTRSRRVRQLGVATLACYLGSTVALLVSEKTGAGWLEGVGLILFLTSFVALLALAWTAVWRFPDEEEDPLTGARGTVPRRRPPG